MTENPAGRVLARLTRPSDARAMAAKQWFTALVLVIAMTVGGVGYWQYTRHQEAEERRAIRAESERYLRELEETGREARRREYQERLRPRGEKIEMLTPDGDVRLVPEDDAYLGAALANGWIIRYPERYAADVDAGQ